MNQPNFVHYLCRAARALFCLLLIGWAWLALLPAAGVYGQEVDPAATHRADVNALLAQDLAQADGPISFLVVLGDQMDAQTLAAAGEVQAASVPERRAALYKALTAHAERTQAPLRAWLDAKGVAYKPHYLVNMIEVEGDGALAEQLRLRPEVDRLARNPLLRDTHTIDKSTRWPQLGAASLHFTPVPKRSDLTPAAPAMTAALPYGLSYTHADQVWALGVRGQGIVVASQDTGVQWDHPALIGAYRGWNTQTLTATHAYNWFDVFGRSALDAGCAADPQIPCDDQGHGTHTVGTMVGDAGSTGGSILGMAPDAQWIACRNMRGGVGTPASYTTCFEWFLAPYPQGGDPFVDGKPEAAPDIINNSWGCPPSEGCDAQSLRQVADTIRTAGIFIAASAGNDGYTGCSSVVDPIAIYDSSFTVGAHDAQGNIAYFSSRGPVLIDGSKRPKPDITAPGVAVYSTSPVNSYTLLSGTSMASPHVAGAVALLWSVAPELRGDIDRTEQILTQNAMAVPSSECSTDPTPQTPNNVFGYGRLNIMQAVIATRPPATVTVTVVTSESLPLAGLPIELVNQQTGYRVQAVTNEEGKVQLPADKSNQLLLSGPYNVRISQCTSLTDTATIILAPNTETQATVVAPATFCQFLPIISP